MIKYIKKIVEDTDKYNIDHPIVNSKVMILNKNFTQAENCLLSNNLIREAYDIFYEIQKYDIAYQIAVNYSFTDLQSITDWYFDYLIQQRDYVKAANLYLNKGKGLEAVELLCKYNLFIKASSLIIDHSIKVIRHELIKVIVKELLSCRLYNKIAEIMILYEALYSNANEKINYFLLANNYAKAKEAVLKVLTASNSQAVLFSPNDIEEKWGDFYFEKCDYEGAITHYIEAENKEKHIMSLIKLKRFTKAEEMLNENKLISNPQFSKVVRLLSFSFLSTNEHAKVIVYGWLSKSLDELIEEIFQRNKLNLINQLLDNLTRKEKIINNLVAYEEIFNDVKDKLINKAKDTFSKNKAISESILIKFRSYKELIQLYKECKNYKNLVALIDLLPSNDDRFDIFKSIMKDVLSSIGSTKDKTEQINLKEILFTLSNKLNHYLPICECYIINANTSLSVKYLEQELSATSTLNDESQIFKRKKLIMDFLLQFSDIFNNEESILLINNLLIKYNTIDILIKFLCDVERFDDADRISESIKNNNSYSESKFKEFIFYKKALSFKKKGLYSEAEAFFVKSNKPKDAIVLNVELENYENAFKIAETYIPGDQGSIESIFLSQGFSFARKNDLSNPEKCFIKANAPEKMYEIYIKKNQKDQAEIFAKSFCPDMNMKNLSKNSLDRIQIREENFIDVVNDKDSSNDSDDLNTNTQSNKFNTTFKNTLSIILDYGSINKLLQLADKNSKLKNYQEASELILSIQDLYNRGYTKIDLSDEKLLEYLNLATEYFYKIKSTASNKNELRLLGEEISSRYINFNNYIKASEIFVRLGKIDNAFFCLIKGKNFKEAQSFINSKLDLIIKDKKKVQQMKEKYMQILKDHQVNNSKDSLINYNEMDNLFLKEEYISLMKYISSFGTPELFDTYFIKICSVLFSNKKFFELCEFLLRVKFDINDQILNLLKSVTYEILAEENLEELEVLKFVFTKYSISIQTFMVTNKVDIDFQNEINSLSQTSHYQFMKYLIKPYKNRLERTYQRLCLTMLKFSNIIKYDVALYDLYCNYLEENNNENAYYIGKKYVTAYMAIENNNLIEDEFIGFDFINSNFFMSKENLLSKEKFGQLIQTLSLMKEKFFLKLIEAEKSNTDNYYTNTK